VKTLSVESVPEGSPRGDGDMRILVVGSGGVGSAFAPIAARRDFYEHIVFADIDGAKAQRIVDRYGSVGRFAAAKVDATDATQVADAARAHDCDIILNAADRFSLSSRCPEARESYGQAMSLELHPERP
jgi:saccharopine dehydrogenase-like NADP-dependent oxidoreductase